MTIHWEWGLLALVIAILTIYVLSYYWFLWRSVRHTGTIYGPADPYRRDGQQSRPNVRGH